MNENRDPMFPDTDHLHRWSSDAYPDPGEKTTRIGMPYVRPGAYQLGIAIGVVCALCIAVACILILIGCKATDPPCLYDVHGHVNQPCVITKESVESEKRFQAAVKAEQLKLLKKQHEGISKTMREYRNP